MNQAPEITSFKFKVFTSVAAIIVFIITAVLFMQRNKEFLGWGSENQSLPKLNAFCFNGRYLERLNRKPFEKALRSCRLKHAIQFAVDNPEKSEYSCIHISGRDEKDSRLWYYPHSGSEKSLKIEKGEGNKAFKESIALKVNHKPGKVTISAKFSKSDSNGNCPEIKGGKCAGSQCCEQKIDFEIIE